MQTLTIGKETFHFPEKLEQISRKQYKDIAPWIMVDTSANRSVLLMKLVKESKKQLKKAFENLLKVHATESNVVWKILRMVNWAYETRKVDPRSKIKSEKRIEPIIRDFKIGDKKYILPKPNLFDITIGEWAYIDAYLNAYVRSPSQEGLIKLAAVICRPSKPKKELNSPGYNGFPRIDFNPETIESRAKDLEKLPLYVQHTVLDFIIRSGQYLKKRYPTMFQGKSSKGESYGWEGTITNLAESQVFGTELQVRDILIHKCCLYLSKKLHEAKKRKEQNS